MASRRPSRVRTRRRARSNPRGILTVYPEGFGFVRTAEGEFFIPKSKMAGAFDGDAVEVAPLPGARGPQAARPAARIVQVVDRAHAVLVGRYEVAEPFGVVVPEDPRIPYDIFTRRADHPEVPDGAFVRVRIASYPSRHAAATGVIEEVVDRAEGGDIAADLIAARYDLETRFSEGALAEAAAAALDEAGARAMGYRDECARFAFTIDPSDARDFDDALSLDEAPLPLSSGDGAEVRPASRCVLRGGGEPGAGKPVWRLGVHIADVSHHVPWGSSLDLDARRRATSVYLVDRVIPMLPEELSCDLCSLKPGEVRRSMTVDLYLDACGLLCFCEVYPALIRSDARLSYDEAQGMLEGCGASAGEARPPHLRERLTERLAALSRIAGARARRRERAGGLDFATAEAKVRLDAQGHPTAIDIRRKTQATALVEEAMILANEAVARLLRDAGHPGLFRVHERPSEESLVALVPVLKEFPWFVEMDQARFAAGDPAILQGALKESAGRAEGELVSSLLLRAMKRAVYRPSCEGHYGLASAAYAHFTSPIRRYPDLVVHRMLKALLFGRPERFDQEVSALPWIAEHSSAMERAAERAARESQEAKIIEYLEREVGRAFPGIISGVSEHGVHVRLENTAEGFIPVRDLGREYFSFDAALHRLEGQESGTAYRLGQRLPIVIAQADARLGRLRFRPARPGRRLA